MVLVHDSKHRTGGTLRFTPAAWQAFVGELREPHRS